MNLRNGKRVREGAEKEVIQKMKLRNGKRVRERVEKEIEVAKGKKEVSGSPPLAKVEIKDDDLAQVTLSASFSGSELSHQPLHSDKAIVALSSENPLVLDPVNELLVADNGDYLERTPAVRSNAQPKPVDPARNQQVPGIVESRPNNLNSNGETKSGEQNKKTWKNHIKLNPGEIQRCILEFSNSLVGRVMGDNFSFGWTSSQLKLKWNHLIDFKVLDLGERCFLLQFASKDDRDLVWKGGPWYIGGCPIGFVEWKPGFRPSKHMPMQVATWVKLPLLPLECWTNPSLYQIASVAGEPICIDPFTANREKTSYARVCVLCDYAKPMPNGYWIDCGGTSRFFQEFKYEISDLCTSCGFVGHTKAACKAIGGGNSTSSRIGNYEKQIHLPSTHQAAKYNLQELHEIGERSIREKKVATEKPKPALPHA